MNNEYLLFYSKNCIYSTDFINKLFKNQDLYKKFILINVNNKSIKIPNFVKSVPTILITENSKRELLVGSQVFNWLKKFTKEEVKKGIENWDPITMSGYSDSFSYIEEGNAMEKNYSFLNSKIPQINTPSEGSNVSKNASNQVKSKTDMAYENLINKRKMEIPNPIRRE